MRTEPGRGEGLLWVGIEISNDIAGKCRPEKVMFEQRGGRNVERPRNNYHNEEK